MNEESKRNVSVIQDMNGHNIVVINDIIFKGKQAIQWNDVEEYLRRYVGDFYMIADTKEIVYIGSLGVYQYFKGSQCQSKSECCTGDSGVG